MNNIFSCANKALKYYICMIFASEILQKIDFCWLATPTASQLCNTEQLEVSKSNKCKSEKETHMSKFDLSL